MTIVPLIQRIVKNRFGTYFNGIESFYLKNFLILIQGLLSKDHTSISAIAADEHYHIAHTTLTRFLQSHEGFWNALKSLLLSLFRRDMEEPLEESNRYSRVLIIDDTLVTRRGKKIPFASRQYDHCDNRFTHGQVILTVGEIKNKTFQPLDMLFSKSSEEERGSSGSKIDMAISWLKHNEVRHAVVIADSWYTNAPLIESCKQWFDSDFIGQLKSTIILCVDGQVIKAGTLLSDSTMNRSTRLGGKTIHYHSYLAHILSIRIPVKIVVTELEDHSRAILTSTDTQLSSERIIQYYSLRWSIESFFKFAKQNLSLSKCQIRSEQAQKHYMILVSIAYLIFNDLIEMIQTKQENVPHHKIFYAIRVAVSILALTFVYRVSVSSSQIIIPEYRYSKPLQLLLHSLLLIRT